MEIEIEIGRSVREMHVRTDGALSGTGPAGGFACGESVASS
jgi:hypothetical protein